MAISFNPTAYSGKAPVFWRGEAKVLPGGYQLTDTLPAGVVIPKGTFVAISNSTLSANLCKYNAILDGSTISAIRVAKGTLFIAEDVFYLDGDDTLEIEVQRVDRSDAAYDVIVPVADQNFTSISGVTAITSISASETDYDVLPNAVVATDFVVKDHGVNTIDLAYDAVVINNTAACGAVPATFLNGICLKGNPNIIIIKQ